VAANEQRASDLLGRRVTGADGRDLGRVADLVVHGDAIVAIVVTRGPWGRLLGYERDQVQGPGILEAVARRILRRNSEEIPWADVRFE
jgi:sporulation protein YlmC with PRC-barrel domain